MTSPFTYRKTDHKTGESQPCPRAGGGAPVWFREALPPGFRLLPAWVVWNRYRRKSPEVKAEERAQGWSIRLGSSLVPGIMAGRPGLRAVGWWSWKRFSGRASSFTVTFWNFPGTLQTVQQASKAEEQQWKFSAWDEKKYPSSNAKGSQVCRAPAHRLLHTQIWFSMFHTQLSPWLLQSSHLRMWWAPRKELKSWSCNIFWVKVARLNCYVITTALNNSHIKSNILITVWSNAR